MSQSQRSTRRPLKETTAPNAARGRRVVKTAPQQKAAVNGSNAVAKTTVRAAKRPLNKPETAAPGTSQGRSTNKRPKLGESKDHPPLTSEDKRPVIVEKDLIPLPEIPGQGGTILTVGTGDIGQLGLGEDILEKTLPAAVQMNEMVVDVMAGGMHTICLTKSGDVFTFGCNDEGALGRDTTNNEAAQYLPQLVNLPEKAVQISAGDSHSAALTASGKVYIWGNFRDNSGKMGLLPTEREGTSHPVLLMAEKVVQIASGGNHFVCLGSDGAIYSCGNSEHGQLGRVSPYNLERGGRRGLDHILKPQMVKFKSRQKKFDRVWCGTYTSFVRAQDSGEIYGFGLNACYQLGLPNGPLICVPQKLRSFNDRRWIRIVSGEQHTIALDSNGHVFSLGRYDYGRLGQGQKETNEDCEEPTQVKKLDEIECIDIACGSVVSYAVAKTGELFSWGSNVNNQLGQRDEDDVFEPKEVVSKAIKTRKCLKASGGGQHSVFLAADSDPVET